LNNADKYTPGFVKNYGMSWGNQRSYSMSERVQTDLFSGKLKTGEDILLMVLQYLQALSVAQQRYRFTHNDSHLENILVKPVSEQWVKMHVNSFKSPVSTEIDHVEFYMRSPGWTVKINDYGLSRLENHNKTYIGVQTALRNFGKFSHSVDYLTLFGCMFYPGFNAAAYVGGSFYTTIQAAKAVISRATILQTLATRLGFTGANAVSHMMYSIVAPSLFNNTLSAAAMDTELSVIYNNANFYRPAANNMFSKQSMFLTPDRAILNVLPLFARLNLVVSDRPSIPSSNLKEYINYRPIHNNMPFIKKSVSDTVTAYPLFPGTILYSNILGNQVIPNTVMKATYNIGDNISGCLLSQYVHLAAINMNNLRASNMQFVSDCCNIDVAEFFEQPNRFGVAINGVFFNILESNFPIGPYKDRNIPLQQRLQIPNTYAPYYGLIGYKNPTPGSDGQFLITSIAGLTANDINSFDYASVCGPVLVDAKRKYVFSETDIEILNDPDGLGLTKIFQCANPPEGIAILGQFTTPVVNGSTIINVTNTDYLADGDEIMISTAGRYRITSVSLYRTAVMAQNLGGESNSPPNTLTNGGVITRVSDTTNILNPGKRLLRCNTQGAAALDQTVFRHPNCAKIAAGHLSHGGNLNPRTAIAFNSTAGILYFVVIEGRNARGSGQDFVKMVNTLYSIDPGITMAVNLDGGGSTAMAWRTPADPTCIVNVNATRQSPYPVGNIFAVINK